ncbi:MAG: c-type cytochrome [Flavobacterium sp.]
MKIVYRIALLAGIATLVTSCFDTKSPNYQYFPNMYEAVSYETYSEHDAFNRGGVEAQLPPEGTVSRGYEVYESANTVEGYMLSKTVAGSQLDPKDYDAAKAGALYGIYCAICHGGAGDGKGPLVTKEKFLGVPNYKDREITEESIFHVQTFGLNSMGAYSNQLNAHERRMVAKYVLELKSKL